MIEHIVEQGSDAWRSLRLGIPTASCFDQIVTPSRGELSKSSVKYAYRLICERLLKAPTDTLDGLEWVEHGKEMEPFAAKQYSFVADVDTRLAGFFTTNDGAVGASPDRVIIGRNAALEIKCPSPWVHLGYLLDGPGVNYRPQVQGQLLVCEFDYVDFYSYHGRMPAGQTRTGRDEPFIKLLSSALTAFVDQLAEMTARAKALGVFQAYDTAVTVEDVERAAQLRRELDPALREA